MEKIQLSPSDFIALTNQTLEYAYPSVEIVGEISSFKINQDKYVFFDIKDENASVGCFMMRFQLRIAIEDGMQVVITAQPKLTQWGKFSLTVRSIQPIGEGSLKRSFELLKAKLTKEGLFDPLRKRSLPELPTHIGVISSTQAAGYADFVKILDERWGGMQVDVAHTQVQGEKAAPQIMAALQYFNETAHAPEVVVIVRGGGSLEDLSSFNEEPLVRAIASSRLPVLTGIGHEIDVSLADMAADKAASTPSNAAQLLVPDKEEVIRRVHSRIRRVVLDIEQSYSVKQQKVSADLSSMVSVIEQQFDVLCAQHTALSRSLQQLHPKNVLRRGYSLVKLENGGSVALAKKGDVLKIETSENIIKAGVIANDKK